MSYILNNYNILLVLFSYSMSVLGSFMALLFAKQALQWPHNAGRLQIMLLAAISLGGIGIWSMHFIGMLAYEVKELEYDIFLTIASFAIAVVVVLFGFWVIALGKFNYIKLLSAGLIVGLGVAAMHYSGMAAVRADIVYDFQLVRISVAIAIAAATVALWLMFHVAGMWQITVSAVVMGIAVCGMHYTAMAAATIGGRFASSVTAFNSLSLSSIIVLIDVCLLSLMGFLGWVFHDRLNLQRLSVSGD